MGTIEAGYSEYDCESGGSGGFRWDQLSMIFERVRKVLPNVLKARRRESRFHMLDELHPVWIPFVIVVGRRSQRNVKLASLPRGPY